MGRRFFQDPRGEYIEAPWPRRVYATVYGVEESPGERSTALLEAIDADQIDLHGEPGERFGREHLQQSGLSILEIPDTAYPRHNLGPPGTVLDIELDGGGPVINQYLNLYSPPVSRRLGKVGKAAMAAAAKIRAATRMDDLPDAAETEIRMLLDRTPPGSIEGLLVVDVGQGNCNALVDCEGIPRLYFDMGGGVTGNRNTWPANSVGLSCEASPPIILSHWDWDHWGAAFRDPLGVKTPWLAAQDLMWIVPRDRALGVVHAAFLDVLVANKKVLVWPDSLPAIRTPNLHVRKCHGADRNDSGLALIARLSGLAGNFLALLTGDASYHAIDLAAWEEGEIDVVVAPHHGGRVSFPEHRPSNVAADARIIYSAGLHNQWGHPYKPVMARDKQVWPLARLKHTRRRRQQGLGAGLGCHLTPGLFSCPCGHPACDWWICRMNPWTWT